MTPSSHAGTPGRESRGIVSHNIQSLGGAQSTQCWHGASTVVGKHIDPGPFPPCTTLFGSCAQIQTQTCATEHMLWFQRPVSSAARLSSQVFPHTVLPGRPPAYIQLVQYDTQVYTHVHICMLMRWWLPQTDNSKIYNHTCTTGLQCRTVY